MTKMIPYNNSFQSFSGNYYSNSFLNLNADLSVNIAFELVNKIKPEYLLITRKKDNEIFRYIYYTYEFVKTVNAYPEDWKYLKKNLTLEKVLNLHEYTSDRTIEINDDFPLAEKNLEIINNLKNLRNISKIIIISKDNPRGIISFDSKRVLDNMDFLNKGLPKTRGFSPKRVARAGRR